MRGHSRGEWWGTLDDVVDSEEDAEYWAIFGVTHRGNKHCLGEFPSKSAAMAARHGARLFPKQQQTKPRDRVSSRKIVQLKVESPSGDTSMVELFALCDDGTVWHRGIGVRESRGFVDEVWEEVTLDGMESDQ